ncbi:DUF7309 domain-containing protein [Anaerobaca lacustris]|uniref:SEC-C metal-binding domain-containing protein n=1 Tax=Anaerobaca lacustris TaxID=3044600 RepID=A0AAW6TYK1_9BACT|nr:SEC-C metal-binding domain-containing protein [Sedimentisphaerales bacterium M17dextr]
MERHDIAHAVLHAADEFNSRKLWARFTNYDCFGVRIEGQDDLMLGAVLGNAGEEYGLSLFRGPHAAASLHTILDPEGQDDDALDDMDILSFNMETFGDLLPDARTLLRKAGLAPRRSDQVPQFLAKPAGHQVRLADETELSLLHLILRAAVEADRKKQLHPHTLGDEEGICVLNVSGHATAPQVSVTRERFERQAAPDTIPLLPATHGLGGLARLEATWLIGMPTVPAGIQGDDRTMQILLVVDEASEYVLRGETVLGGNIREAAAIVVETFHGKGLTAVTGLPDQIVFSSRKLYEAMAPSLEQVGVQCAYESEIPTLRAIVAGFVARLGMASPRPGETAEPADAWDNEVPASDDLEGWKEVDRRLFQRFARHFEEEDRLWSSRPIRRYFNDDDLDYYLDEHEQQRVAEAYTAWGILDYRPNKNSRTHAEKMLEKGLPEAEALLLRARMESCPTLYRVAGHNAKAGTIDLEDVLLGGTVTVNDKAMSKDVHDSIFLVARVSRAGQFHFIEVAGPPLGAGMGLHAVEFLRNEGVEFTREGLRADAHKLGWLWGWMDDWQANWQPPHTHNTDSHELLWHTASFSVAEPEQVREVLKKREDVDYDEEVDEFVWSRDAETDSGMPGQRVMLGRLEFVGDELVLTVNSAERFEAGRRWLDKLPGVAFEAVTTRSLDRRAHDLPLDEKISESEPIEITPEIESSLQDFMNKHYMGWIDTPLPALGGKTPRQTCRTEAGRQRVLTLIRTMPDPCGPVAVKVPRTAMMAELGLTEQASPPAAGVSKPDAPIPISAIPPKPKAARNAPCPCGSGHKYKKCCGR